jgi:hypothetical protein
MAAHSADLPSKLTEVGAADRAADRGNPDSRHKDALKNRLLEFHQLFGEERPANNDYFPP